MYPFQLPRVQTLTQHGGFVIQNISIFAFHGPTVLALLHKIAYCRTRSKRNPKMNLFWKMSMLVTNAVQRCYEGFFTQRTQLMPVPIYLHEKD